MARKVVSGEGTALRDLVQQMKGWMQGMADDLAQLKHVLIEGNGTPPLTTTVARLDERVGVLERTRLSPYERALLISAFAGGGISLLDMVLRFFGK